MNHRHFWRPLTGALLITLLLVSCSKPTKIEGQVYLSEEKNIPFPGVTISLKDTSLPSEDPNALVAEVTSDASGKYDFSNIEPGTYMLVAEATITELPSSLTECPGGLYFIRYEVGKDWWINSNVTPDGHVNAFATSAAEVTVSAGDVVRYDLNFACK